MLILPYPQLRVLWVAVPKAGIKSTNAALHMLDPRASWEPEQMTAHELDVERTYRWRNWWCFTVVRHPLERFESMFYQRVNVGRIDDYAACFLHWPAWQADPHAMRQTDLIGPTLERYDYVGHLEQMDEVAATLRSVAGDFGAMPHANRSERGPKLSGEARAGIAAYYAADFELLGYEP